MAKTKELTVRDERYDLADQWLKTYLKGRKLQLQHDDAVKELNELNQERQVLGQQGNRLEADLKRRVFDSSNIHAPIKCIILSDTQVLIIPVDGPCTLLGAV